MRVSMSVTISLSSTDLNELFAEVGGQLEVVPDQTTNELALAMPPRLGRGSMRAITLRPGFTLFLLDYCLDVELRLAAHTERPRWGSTFCLTGQFSCSVRELKTELRFNASRHNIYVGSNTGNLTVMPAGQPIRLAGLYLLPEWLESLLADEQTTPPAVSHALHRPAQDPPYSRLDAQTPLMQIALAQLFHCPYQGALRRLYLESKALELLTLQIGQLQTEPDPRKTVPRLSHKDVERIYRARDILLQNLAQPPSLLALARQVGINDFKLKRGFRHVFGTSAFAYLHAQRMEQARLLLAQGDRCVKEVAATVGYASLGHFTAAFTKRFGVPPSLVRSHS